MNQYFSGINLNAVEKYANLRHIFLNVAWINNYNKCRISQYEASNVTFSSILSHII